MSYNFCTMKNLTHINFNRKNHTMQLKMKFDVETYISKDNKVQLVCNLIEEMNLSSLLSTYSNLGRKPAVDPVSLLKILLFCYSEGITTSRKIEEFCKFDTRAFVMLEGTKAPDHTTINRFRKNIESFSEDLLTQFVDILIKEGHVNMKTIYIDGTKIESLAGRYTFVWRKSVEKYQNKILEQVITEFDLPKSSNLKKVVQHLRSEFNRLRNQCSSENIIFVYGKGKRKTKEQRTYEDLKDKLSKLETYDTHLKIMGERNSYSKTDHDATFMRMKEDHMMNGQLKPAYNIQVASNGAFIVGVMGSQKSNDLHTLKPFLDKMLIDFRNNLECVATDAGYESVENYAYLKEKEIKAYIKPANHEIKKKKKHREDIGKRENMTYVEEEDVYICKNGKKLIRGKDTVKVYSSGYKDTIYTYSCVECIDCTYNSACIKSRKNENGSKKTLKYSPDFEKYRKESEENLSTKEGINHRINRSIQSEGVFSKLKDGLGYNRFHHRGMKSIVSDMILMSLGINLNKLHTKLIQGQSKVIEYKKAA